MVEPDHTFVEVPCELELGRDDDPAAGRLILTEGGDLSIQFEEGGSHRILTSISLGERLKERMIVEIILLRNSRQQPRHKTSF